MGVVSGRIYGVYHKDIRVIVLNRAITKWYQHHRLYDKIARIRVIGNTISVRIKKGAKHTWREIQPNQRAPKLGSKVAAVSGQWYLVITDDRTKEKE